MKCVRVDYSDSVSRDALRSEGWGYVGDLLEYRGGYEWKNRKPSPVQSVNAGELRDLICSITWKNRLVVGMGQDKAREFIATDVIDRLQWWDGFHVYVSHGSDDALDGFIAIHHAEPWARIEWFGVIKALHKIKTARPLWETAMNDLPPSITEIRAGTYDSNEDAIRFYTSHNMELKSRLATYQKDED